jgi:uncharacterized protein (DUF2236 family)
MTPILPDREEAESLIPPRDGIVCRIAGDGRLFTASGYALMLQVAHPTVGAGVAEHSNFQADPWGRLFRTLDYTTCTIYGGPELAWSVGRRVREMHKQIKGVRPDGERYHALEPKAYAWVHATLAEAIVAGHQKFSSPTLTPAEVETFWHEWRPVGRLVGVRLEDLPETWGDFQVYLHEMVESTLERTEAVVDVLDSLSNPAAPPVPAVRRERIWKLLRGPVARPGETATLGLLPPVLRERFGIEWTRWRQREFDAAAAISRRSRPLMPKAARDFGPHYLRWRREAIARGDVASGKGSKHGPRDPASRDPAPA